MPPGRFTVDIELSWLAATLRDLHHGSERSWRHGWRLAHVTPVAGWPRKFAAKARMTSCTNPPWYEWHENARKNTRSVHFGHFCPRCFSAPAMWFCQDECVFAIYPPVFRGGFGRSAPFIHQFSTGSWEDPCGSKPVNTGVKRAYRKAWSKSPNDP